MIEHQNVTQQVIDYMKENIISGKWKVGEKIPSENELRNELGVSRSSVRQAVSYYAGIRVLESVHGKGNFLIDNELDDLSNKYKITAEDCANTEKVLEFRRIIESEACYLATINKSEELIKNLKKYLQTMKDNHDDAEKFVTADIRFHRAIAHASGNLLLEKSLRRIFQENKKSQILTWTSFGEGDGIYYHQRILNAIEEGAPEKARQYMHEHLQIAMDKIKAKEQ